MAVRLETLHERPDLPAYELPRTLADAYGGTIGFDGPTLYANFVTSLDGVVAVDDEPPSVVSGKSEADRFVMGLLRACAEVVIVGAGTLRAEPDHLWTAEHIYPDLSAAFAELRSSLGLPSVPRLVLLTESGEIDPGGRAFEQQGAVVVTVSPRLFGRDGLSHRLGLVEGHAFDPRDPPSPSLASVKRHASHLFLRYRFGDQPGDQAEP